VGGSLVREGNGGGRQLGRPMVDMEEQNGGVGGGGGGAF